MTKGLRWRVLVLQIALVGVLSFVAGFAFTEANFSHSQVQSQLSAQKIFFPAAGDKALAALPAADRTAMEKFAGQQLTTGEQAEVYADHFIAVHLKGIAGGKTYSQVSALSIANPKDTALAGQVQTLFRGETLRGLLLNSYGWWQIGTYAFFAATGLVVAAGAVMLALVIELALWVAAARQRRATPAAQPVVRGARPAVS